MGIEQTHKLDHWEDFLTIENDILLLSRYIEFSDDNFSCYSMEMARLLMQTCSEIDVIMRQICTKLAPNENANNINAYCNIITSNYKMFIDFPVTIRRFGLSYTPWVNWENRTPPFWWTAHNKVKHKRHEKFHDANLKNVLNSTAGLFILLLYLYREEALSAKLYPNPTLFSATAGHQGGFTQDQNSGLLIANYMFIQ